MSMHIKSPAGTPDIPIHSVRVKRDTAPQDMVLTGIVRDSWWWHDNTTGDYLNRANADAEGNVSNRACLASGTLISCPVGYQVQITCDKPALEITAEFVNADGSRDTVPTGGWGAQPRVFTVPAGSDFIRLAPLFRNADNSSMSISEMPTEVYVHFVPATT